MILRTIATIILWGVLGFIVYGLKEPGAMWILNLCATLTLLKYILFWEKLDLPPTASLAWSQVPV